jgi:hypothetical protein
VSAYSAVRGLRNTAEIFVCNVDRNTREEETLIRLGKYADVCWNDRITLDSRLMKGRTRRGDADCGTVLSSA